MELKRLVQMCRCLFQLQVESNVATHNSRYVFTSSGALTVTNGPVSLEVFMLGGGGGGGGCCGGSGVPGRSVTHADITCNNGPNAVVIGTGGARRSSRTDTTTW